MTRTISATKARVHFGEITRNVEERGEIVVVERDGREVVAIIPIADYHQYRALRANALDWWRMMDETHDFICQEIGDRTLTPADDLLRQIREERDAELADLS